MVDLRTTVIVRGSFVASVKDETISRKWHLRNFSLPFSLVSLQFFHTRQVCISNEQDFG